MERFNSLTDLDPLQVLLSRTAVGQVGKQRIGNPFHIRTLRFLVSYCAYVGAWVRFSKRDLDKFAAKFNKSQIPKTEALREEAGRRLLEALDELVKRGLLDLVGSDEYFISDSALRGFQYAIAVEMADEEIAPKP
jgi:hypothetical protein